MEDSKYFIRRIEECSYTSQQDMIYEDHSQQDKKWKESCPKRKRVEKALSTFRELSHKLYSEYKSKKLHNLKAKTKALVKAAMLMKERHQCENTSKIVGHVDGIEVGDKFQYRTELIVIGLHQQFNSGIDYMGKGENSWATSIVVTHRYDNVIKTSGCLVYEGHGGNPNVRAVVPHDQLLKGGNLALLNSMKRRSPVRVILKKIGKFDGMEEWKNNVSNCSYVYDGLYFVDKMNQERGQFGKLVFKFVLNKIWDKPAQVCARDVQRRYKSKGHVLSKEVVRNKDISEGKEKFSIRVVTPSNCVEIPRPFGYLVNMIYPKMNHSIIGSDCGCNCLVDCFKCVCIDKNGGTIAYDGNKRLVSPLKSSFIYECGPSCICSSSCINRVAQLGIQFQLEIFKTKSKGWGVRTRSFIPSGSFVCELVGEVGDNKKSRSNQHGDDDYVFNIGAGAKGFIDATRHGNVGRFINHSCCPNLCVKDVLYDHNDKRLPHKMLFAMKGIPAGRELSYDYNCFKRNVKVLNTNCHCDSSECNGQIYI